MAAADSKSQILLFPMLLQQLSAPPPPTGAAQARHRASCAALEALTSAFDSPAHQLDTPRTSSKDNLGPTLADRPHSHIASDDFVLRLGIVVVTTGTVKLTVALVLTLALMRTSRYCSSLLAEANSV